MNRLFTHLLRYSFVLLALSVALPSFSQGGGQVGQTYGPPKVRKEADDGGGVDFVSYCLSPNYGAATYIYTITVFDPFFYQTCDLYAGYSMPGTSTVFVHLPPSGFSPNSPPTPGYSTQISVTIPLNIIIDACDEGLSSITVPFGLYCFDGTNYNAIIFDPEPGLNEYELCCNSGREEDPLMQANDITDFNSFKLDQDGNLMIDNVVNSTTIDYHIYDVSGNQAKIVKGITRDQNIQQVVWNTGLPTGIYIIRFMEDGEVKTKKVFKP